RTNRNVSLYIENKLKKHGFATERITYLDRNKVRKFNIVGKKGNGQGGLAYSCHSDVVPAEKWHSKKKGPFQPGIARDRLYGRGSCDMKGSIACMLEAVQSVSWDKMKAPIYFICTADEECGFEGAKQVTQKSDFYREIVEHQTPMIIGEPTLLEVIYSHKGSYLIEISSKGISAHSSTREGRNANLAMIPVLHEAKKIHDELEEDPRWQNTLFEPATMSWNIGINDHTSAINMTPSQSKCTIYFRPMPSVDYEPVLKRLEDVVAEHGLKMKKNKYGDPVYTDPESDFVQTALELSRKRKPRTVAYGTDGGAFTEVKNKIIFGPGNIAQAHTFNEWIAIEQLSLGTQMYAKFLQRFCCEE
ncbi:MAG: M20/M25/M40 family metallo-hydrolase, partial [Planctomycetota bacterium]|nr:M20/M25/M40 family metallo-hydrolase [Planctomycetota bacterium]